ncbi:MAG: hypothetical protein E7158_03105 [Firmicutes bacterium]|nr:hypothetical protein [Bacillota bacterium]
MIYKEWEQYSKEEKCMILSYWFKEYADVDYESREYLAFLNIIFANADKVMDWLVDCAINEEPLVEYSTNEELGYLIKSRILYSDNEFDYPELHVSFTSLSADKLLNVMRNGLTYLLLGTTLGEDKFEGDEKLEFRVTRQAIVEELVESYNISSSYGKGSR